MDTVLTFAELLELVLAYARNRMPDRAFNTFSDNYKRLQVLAGALADTHFTIRVGNKAFSPFDAEGEFLDVWGSLRNVTRRGATQASAEDAGLVRGTAGGGGSWVTTDLLIDPVTQLQYAPTVGGTVGAGATDAVGLIAVVAGSAGIAAPPNALQWVSTPAGLENEVRLLKALNDTGTGLDAEEDDEYRDRVIAAWQQVNKGGSPPDYLDWILASNSAIATGYVWKGRNGRGTVDIAALKAGDGAARLLNTSERADLQAYVEARNPHPEQLRTLEVFGEATSAIQVALEPEPGVAFARDWDDSAGFTVAAYTPATRLLQLSANRPASLQIGSRIVIDDTPGGVLEVQSLSALDSVVLVNDFGYTITVSEEVYAGGGLTEPVWQAIKDFLNALGPRRGNRASAIGVDWFSTADLGRLFEVVQTTAGVLDHTQELPVADVEPTELAFPDDAGVNQLIPDVIVVRYL